MRRIVAATLASSMFVSAPLVAAGAPRAQPQGASLVGTASSSSGQTLANITVQLRDVVSGQLVGTTTSNSGGAFAFSGLQAGNYAVEVVNAAGQIIATSSAISVAAGATVTGITVTATAAAVGAGAAGGAAAAAAAGGTAAAGGISTAVIITSVAAAAGVAGAVAVATNGNASPSR